jgi:hypothetical protein
MGRARGVHYVAEGCVVVALVSILYQRDGMLPERVTDAIDPGGQDEPARNALSLNLRQSDPLLCLG